MAERVVEKGQLKSILATPRQQPTADIAAEAGPAAAIDTG
jgi:hypothetical protein